VLASLHHPRIAADYGIEPNDSTEVIEKAKFIEGTALVKASTWTGCRFGARSTRRCECMPTTGK